MTFKTLLATWLSFHVPEGCKAMPRTQPFTQGDTDLNHSTALLCDRSRFFSSPKQGLLVYRRLIVRTYLVWDCQED